MRIISLTYAVALVRVETVTMVTATAETAFAVLAVMLTATLVDRALVLVRTVRAPIHIVSRVTGARVATVCVVTDVVTSTVPQAFVDI